MAGQDEGALQDLSRAVASLGSHRTRRAARKLIAWVVALTLLSAASGAAAPRPEGPQPASGPARGNFDAKKQFTITKIEPDAGREEVRIFFSQPIHLAALRANLRLLPHVKIDWKRSTLSTGGILTLRGAFRYGTGYLVLLPDNLMVGTKSYIKTVGSFFMPDRPPKVEFVERKTAIERDSRQLLHVRAQNVNNLMFEGIKVPPLLLPWALAVEKAPQDWEGLLDRLKSGQDQSKSLVEKKKELAKFVNPPLLERQLFPAVGEKNKLWVVSLPLGFRKGKEAGALELIRVKDNQSGSAASTGPRVFQITDLGLTYKRGAQDLLVWVTSLKKGTPVAGAQVVGFTTDMEVFPLGQTDAEGILIFRPAELEGLSIKSPTRLEPVRRLVEKDRLAVVMVGTQDDVSFIELQPGGNLKPQGIWQVQAGEKVRYLKGHVFTERGVYRPGEKVYFKGAVREYREGRIFSPPGERCSFEVISPKGEKVFTLEGQASDFGTAAGEITTQGHWPLGTYTLKLAFGPQDEEELTPKKGRRFRRTEAETGEGEGKAPKNEVNCTFQLQEFKPPRHFAEISFQQFTRPLKEYVNLGEKKAQFVRIAFSGSYYAGGPVKHGQVRWKIHKSKTSYQVSSYEDFTFGYDREEQGELIESGQAILDEKGRAELEFPLDRQVLAGQQGLYVVATVVDFDGRAATETKAFQTEPDILVGISRHPGEVASGDEQLLRVMVTPKGGKPVQSGTVQAEILQKAWAYVAKRNEQGDLYWDDQEVWRKTVTTDLPLDKGTAAFRFDFGWGGRYLLAFTYRDGEGRAFTSATAYEVRGEDFAYEHKDKPYQPLALSADKEAYAPGQTAKIAARPRTPVSRYLVTLEQKGVLQYRVVTPKSGGDQLEIPINAEYAPNVYVSVLGLTPRGEFPVYAGRYDSEAPSFYWGTINVPVRQDVERLEVKISPEVKELKAEPGTPVTLDFVVSSRKGEKVEAEMAVAVVDEAVLALTGFKTPSLEQLTRFDFPLGVFTGELRTLLVHQTPFYLSRNEPLTGGGGLSDEMISKLRRRFEAVAYFNPSVRTDPAGRARVSFTLPDNLTTYRIYAVALDRGSRFASSERPFLATKDFYLEPGLPGFFTQGDSFRFQVAAFNATTASGPVKFSASADGGLFITAEEVTSQLKAKDSVKLNVNGQAARSGPARARFAGEFQGRGDATEVSIRINSGQIRETKVTFGSLTGPEELTIPLPGYLGGGASGQVNLEEVKAVLTLSGSPFLRISEAIHYLLTYPYGCVEQVSSGVMALAALRGLVQEGQILGVSLEETDKYLNRGVDRILGMQTGDGGFGYWPGQRESHIWGSVYAATALSLAKANGLNVPDEPLNKATEYLKAQIRSDKRSPVVKAFACYPLALNGALDRATFNSVRLDYGKLNRESKILLILAAKQAELRPLSELQAALRPLLGGQAEGAKEEVEDEFRARYRSPALALLAAQSIIPDDPKTEETALLLLGGLDRQGIWTSTSDTGWGLLALKEYFKGATFSDEPMEIAVSQPGLPAVQRLQLDPQGFRTATLDAGALVKNPVVKIQGQPGRTVLYKLELTAPRSDLAATGEASGFKVRRLIKNTDGSSEIKVGDLVKVTVFLDVAGKGQRYVVLDDPLPAGLTALNTAFKTEEPLPEGTEGEDDYGKADDFEYFTREGAINFRPNYFEIRDDRVLAFRDQVYSGPHRFEYYARAVCEGKFVAPATKAAAMYSPEVHGYSPQGELIIKGR